MKTFTLTLTGDEMITLRAAVNSHITHRKAEVELAKVEEQFHLAEYLDNQRVRSERLYAKVFNQHERQCEPREPRADQIRELRPNAPLPSLA